MLRDLQSVGILYLTFKSSDLQGSPTLWLLGVQHTEEDYGKVGCTFATLVVCNVILSLMQNLPQSGLIGPVYIVLQYIF